MSYVDVCFCFLPGQIYLSSMTKKTEKEKKHIWWCSLLLVYMDMMKLCSDLMGIYMDIMEDYHQDLLN